MKAKLITTALLLIASFCIIFPPSVLPFAPTRSYEGMTAISVANEDAPVESLLVINAIRPATEARNMSFRNYDENQPAAAKLLAASGQEPPALIIYDGKQVVEAMPLPSTVEELETALGSVPQ